MHLDGERSLRWTGEDAGESKNSSPNSSDELPAESVANFHRTPRLEITSRCFRRVDEFLKFDWWNRKVRSPKVGYWTIAETSNSTTKVCEHTERIKWGFVLSLSLSRSIGLRSANPNSNLLFSLNAIPIRQVIWIRMPPIERLRGHLLVEFLKTGNFYYVFQSRIVIAENGFSNWKAWLRRQKSSLAKAPTIWASF